MRLLAIECSSRNDLSDCIKCFDLQETKETNAKYWLLTERKIMLLVREGRARLLKEGINDLKSTKEISDEVNALYRETELPVLTFGAYESQHRPIDVHVENDKKVRERVEELLEQRIDLECEGDNLTKKEKQIIGKTWRKENEELNTKENNIALGVDESDLIKFLNIAVFL